MITFDSENSLIILGPGVTAVSAEQLYAAWKQWVLVDTNSRYLPAFAPSVGGEPLGGGLSVGAYFFLQNGWRIRPHEANHVLNITGNLYPIPDTAALIQPTIGNFNVTVLFTRSSIATIVTTGSVAQEDITTIKQAVIDRLDVPISSRLSEDTLITGAKTPGTVGSALQDMSARITGAL